MKLDSIGLVIVTFFPDSKFFNNVIQIKSLVDQLVIVDNHSDETTRLQLKRLESNHLDIKLILNPENVGLATALNQGVATIKDKFKWALLLDQDSKIKPDFRETYQNALLHTNEQNKIMVIGNNYLSNINGKKQPLLHQSDFKYPPIIKCKAVITAGSLIFLPYHKNTKGFRDEFFIDWVDTEYCYRIRKAGYDVMMVTRPVVEQTIGQSQDHNWAKPSNHAPRRRYYMIRNLVILSREYLGFEIMWFVGQFWSSIKVALKIIFFESEKYSKLTHMIRGFWDGICYKLRD